MTDFYTLLPAEHADRPGQLLRTQAVTVPQFDHRTRAWRIMYVSSDSRGEPIPVTATVLSKLASHSTPIVVYCPSFHGLGGPCAPSQQLLTGDEPLEQIREALDREWTVAVPDGENLGVTGLGPHTFLAARAAAHVALDLARAAQSIPQLAPPHPSRVPIVLWGYGDGGRATVWAAGLAPEYAPELDLRGVAAGAVVTDPGALVRTQHRGPWAALALAGLVGLSRAYHHLPLLHVLTKDGRKVARHAEQLSAATLLAQYRQPLQHWCERPDPWNDAIWRFVLTRESRSSAATPAAPIHLYHGTHDPIVPVESGGELFLEYQRRGIEVSWREYEANHLRTAIDSTPEVADTLADFLRRPPTRSGPLPGP